MAPKKSTRAAPERRARAIVPDTSVLVDGRITLRIQRGELKDARLLIPMAVVAELEYQANAGRESGFNGLDEIVKIQELRDTANLDVAFVGERPTPEDIELAKSGEIDAMIREIAEDEGAKLLTSDRVLAHVARAMAIDVEYVRPITEPDEQEKDLSSLDIMKYFDASTMSVHLKYGVKPLAKKGKPGAMKLQEIGREPMELKTLTRMRREIIEAARRDANSFIEIERTGATVVQLGNMRIAIAQPPFSDGLEITAVRPVVRKTLEEYGLERELLDRLKSYQRGVFVSGAPGSGKSTFVTAVAEHLKDQGTIVKTMESPRDLQVGDEITQYAPLDRSMELTSDVLLLVRPDFVVYDEVRKTEDFRIFGDMRLAGVGLIGVTHANRAIDAVQRLIGRVELGMIPQVVDTVVHIEGGAIRQVLELTFTVKVPAGMTEADLARPVIVVRDFVSKRAEYEIYTYGEQVVVMPVGAAEGSREAQSPRDKLANAQLRHVFRGYVEGDYVAEMTGDASCVLYAEEREIPRLIGKGGRTIQETQAAIGIKIDVKPLRERPGRAPRERKLQRVWNVPRAKGRQDEGAWEDDDEDEAAEADLPAAPAEPAAPRERRYAEVTPHLRKTKKNIVLVTDKGLAGQEVRVAVDGEVLFTATVGGKGDIRVSRRTDAGQAILDAYAQGRSVRVRV
ncbi:MAG TPA: PINc/VapC family ATPase [Candidatus Thermoplasmatota archaeon]|nr:PINc/VapC family ATPase [Candidatus Thermoplasmatota archaeon]